MKSNNVSKYIVSNSLHLLLKLLLLVLLMHCLQFPQALSSCRKIPTRECEAICTERMKHNTTTGGNMGHMPDSNCSIRAFVLLPDNDVYVASMARVLPILRVAEQQIRERELLPSYIKFDWMAQDDRCDPAYAVIKAMDGTVKNCAHVLFGPVCDYPLAAVSRITKYFNTEGTPLISIGGFTNDFEKPKTSCDNEFYMLLRSGMLSFETLSELTIAVMKRYNWDQSVFFYENDGQRNVAGLHTCFLMMNSLGKMMRKKNLSFAHYSVDMQLKNRSDEMKREIGNKNSRPNRNKQKPHMLLNMGGNVERMFAKADQFDDI